MLHLLSRVIVPAAMALPFVGGASMALGDLSVTFRSTAIIAASTAIDQFNAPFTIAGLSGITWLGSAATGGDDYLAVMDNSNRLVRLRIQLNTDGTIASIGVQAGMSMGMTSDYEGIAALAPTRNAVLLVEETTPQLVEVSLADGSVMRTIPPPPVFLQRRANFGFESLTARIDEAGNGTVLTANEEALIPDGPQSTQAAGTVVRLLEFAASAWTLTPMVQNALVTEPIHATPISGSRSGVSDLVLLSGGRLLALERSLALSPQGLFNDRIFEIARAGATDVSSLPALAGATYTPVTKRLLWSGDVTNMEGLCLGPWLPGGRRALIGIVDDGDPISVNTVVSFTLSGLCVADFNDSGTVSVQDVFDYVNAWFGGSPSADINGAAGVTVQDLFEFLAAWFAGCP